MERQQSGQAEVLSPFSAMLSMQVAIPRAIRNIAAHGDTDIFPFPFERLLMSERQQDCIQILEKLHADFEGALKRFPPTTIESLSQIGYTSFRRATLIEPFWNAYYLASVISLAKQIEQARIPVADKTVFSYRFHWDKKSDILFRESTWNDYRKESLARSRDSEFVLQTDVADFYLRINHHRLENALQRATSNPEITRRILKLLSIFSETDSYGLPVGGPASRLLAELALNDTDQHLRRRGIGFCRYADDYTFFCDSKSSAYKLIVLLSEKLANDGLSLQKHKTRILTREEFAEVNRFLDPRPLNDPTASEEQKLLNISIRFDPYSPTAAEDYEALKSAVQEVDIIGILSRELAKTTVDQTVAKQAINALKVLAPTMQEQALTILLDKENLLTLAPAFVTVMRAVRGIYLDLAGPAQDRVDEALLELHREHSFLLAVDINLSYYLQALSARYSTEKETVFVAIFDQSNAHYIRRQIILAMAKWKRHYWLTDVKRRFKTYTEWERRAIIVASYRLGEEGKHWRDHNKELWSLGETAVGDWVAERARNDRLDGIT